jgi:hypothetical protein
MSKKPEDFGLEATGNCGLNASEVIPDEDIYQVEFFTDTQKLEKGKLQQRTRLMKPCLFLPLQSAKIVPWEKCIFESSLKNTETQQGGLHGKASIDSTRNRANSCRTRALLSFGCRSKIKMIYYRLPEPLKGDKG